MKREITDAFKSFWGMSHKPFFTHMVSTVTSQQDGTGFNSPGAVLCGVCMFFCGISSGTSSSYYSPQTVGCLGDTWLGDLTLPLGVNEKSSCHGFGKLHLANGRNPKHSQCLWQKLRWENVPKWQRFAQQASYLGGQTEKRYSIHVFMTLLKYLSRYFHP